jgi:hypothetical protein
MRVTMIFLLARALVFGGALILFLALFPVHQLIDQLPSGSVRNHWYAMTAGMCCLLLAT